MLSALDNFDVSHSDMDVSQRSVASRQNLHEVHFEVPAVSLLPHGAMPFLPSPHHIARREHPRQSRNLDTHFNMRLATDTNCGNQAAAPAMMILGNDAESLHAHMTRLNEAPGISTLGFVAYQDEYGFLEYRASLTTTWHTTSGTSGENKLFEVDVEHWIQLLHYDNANEWARMVNHIMQRRSDRAWFHVFERLQAFDSKMAVAQVEMWAGQWDTVRMHSAKYFLEHNIAWEGNSSCEEGKMPCGHMQAITPIDLVERMTVDEAEEYACDTCGAYALTAEQYEEVMAGRDRANRAAADLDQQSWSATERRAALAGHQTFEVTHRNLREAILGTIYSFHEPQSVVPHSMSLVWCHESLRLTQHVTTRFKSDHCTTIVDTGSSPEELFDEFLEVLAENAGAALADDIDQVLPMGYPMFLYDWVSRAFAYLKMMNTK